MAVVINIPVKTAIEAVIWTACPSGALRKNRFRPGLPGNLFLWLSLNSGH